MRENGYLEFSCQSLEFSVNQGELIQDSFVIYAGSVDAEGDIYSSDTRMQVLTSHFGGEEAVIEYSFDGRCIEVGGTVKGYFTIISNQGEYTLAYQVTVQKPILQGSLGNIHNLFHFTNLAKSNWEEAVELFYSPEFINVFRKNEQHYISPYLGLSRIAGNVANVEEFFVEINKKTPIEYRTDVDGFAMEDILDTTQKTITITKSGWGYTDLSVDAEGEFLCVATNKLSNEDFVAGVCHLDFSVDATKLHSGRNIGKLLICDTRTQIVIPITITMNRGNEKQEREKVVRRRSLELIKYYVAMKLRKITLEIWAEKSEQIIEEVIDIEPNNLLAKLYQVQILLRRERFQEAKWHLEQLDCEIAREESGTVARCYYFYLTTLFNRDENYMQTVLNEIETAYMNQDGEWRLAWLLIYMEDEYARGAEFKWHLLEEQFGRGCSSPVLLCEAVLLLQSHPKLLMKLGIFEQSVLWYAAKNHVLKGDVVEKLQYLAAREERFSQLLFRTLCEVYRVNKAPQTVAAICRMLILGEKVGVEYFEWYALGVALELRVTKLYEYYMMSIPMDYKEELPKMVLMYFAYQSNLDYEHNAFLYAYIVRNREKMPDLEQNYRIAIERFVIDQIKLGHINENLAYLYQNILAPQMLRDETAYAFTPLLFSHKIYVENAKITSVVVIHEKIHGESIYPVVNHVCVLPIYGDEYTILLQDAQGNRFTQSIPYENKRLMTPEKLLPFIGTYMEGRLSFDIYQCQVDKGFITITPENEKRFRVLSESEQVIDEFKKEIRGRLLRYYYDNDMIGEMDAFLEEIEATAMETEERAEFIRFMISRGMFEKAYQWLRCYGIAGVNLKPVARLVSRLIVTNQYLEEEFLVNVAYHVFSHTRYDENVLQYLMLYFNGLIVQLREIWKAARELDMDTTHIMHKILEQMRFTNAFIQEKDTLLVEYSRAPEHDEALVQECLRDTAYEYFVLDYVIDTVIFDMLYERYRQTGDIGVLFRLTLLKHWAENEKNREGIMRETIISFVEELLQRNICFEFYQNLVGIVPQLCCFVDKTFIEYKTQPGAKIKIHYLLDNDSQKDEKEYEVEEMPEMYNGIFVKAFSLFHDEVLQYYITENVAGEEQVTESNIIFGSDRHYVMQEGRFSRINDILVSLSVQDTTTAWQLVEEYMQQDFCARELFRVL